MASRFHVNDDSLREHLVLNFKNPSVSVHLLNTYYVLSIHSIHHEKLNAHSGNGK